MATNVPSFDETSTKVLTTCQGPGVVKGQRTSATHSHTREKFVLILGLGDKLCSRLRPSGDWVPKICYVDLSELFFCFGVRKYVSKYLLSLPPEILLVLAF